VLSQSTTGIRPNNDYRSFTSSSRQKFYAISRSSFDGSAPVSSYKDNLSTYIVFWHLSNLHPVGVHPWPSVFLTRQQLMMTLTEVIIFRSRPWLFLISGSYGIFRTLSCLIFHCNLYRAYSRNTEVYPNPEKFDPERFLNEDGSVNKKHDPRAYVFGFGRR
jgi:hypothetical protein